MDLAPEPQESPDRKVYRYLESVVAWGLAVRRLLQERYRATFPTISVSVVYVTGFKSDVLSSQAIISGLLKRCPNSEKLIKSSQSFIQSKAPSYFYGTVHAEATLMGLIASLFLEDHEKDKRNATEITYEGRKVRLEQATISLLVCRYRFCSQYSQF